MSAVADRLRAPLKGRSDRYAVCPEDGFWFRPMYTDGKCPLCGEAVSGGTQHLPWTLRIDRFILALGVMTVVSLAMLGLVLYLFFR